MILRRCKRFCFIVLQNDDIGVPIEGAPVPKMPVTAFQRSQWIEFCVVMETVLSIFWDKAVLKVTEDSDNQAENDAEDTQIELDLTEL